MGTECSDAGSGLSGAGDACARRQGGMHRVFEAVAQAHPHNTAIEFNTEFLTFGELDRRANRIAWSLRHRGVKPGDLVGLYLPKSTALFEAMLGILKAGAGYVPVDLRFPADRIHGIFTDARVRAIVTTQELNGKLKPSSPSRLELDTAARELDTRPSTPVYDEIDDGEESRPCYVIYTSGSTGRPKGVLITHRNVHAFASALRTDYRIQETDRIYQGFSTAFDASVEEIWAAFSTGATLCVPPEEVSRSPADAAEFLRRNQVTYFSTVPTFLSMIPGELPSVSTLVLGGEACPSDLVSRWAIPGRRMLNTYGPTETTVVATMSECHPDEPVTIGRPLPGYAVVVVDEEGQPVPVGTPGELLIGGDAVSSGYLNREALTAEKFIENPFPERLSGIARLYRTHDLVCENADGNIQFLGRIDDQVKIRGFRVELQEIESTLLDEEAIRGAAVKVVHVNGLPDIAAYVMLNDGAELDRDALLARMRTRLPDYMIPRYLDVLQSLPVTTSGKIDRAALPAPSSPIQARMRPVEPPAGAMEERLLTVWSAHFPNAQVSVLDDFFLDLGGHSLLAAQVATELRNTHGISSASVVHLYTFRTIRSLAAFFGEWRAENAPPQHEADAGRNGRRTEAERVFALVPAWQRNLTVAIQALALALYHGIQMAPFVLLGWLGYGALEGSIPLADSVFYGTLVGFMAWPTMLLVAFGTKWLVIGRFRPGRYPLWGSYYCRWWIAHLFQQLSWSHMFSGTPLMSLYYRAMGARVGKRCTIMTPIGSAYDLLSIGDDTSIGAESHLSAYRVENGWLELGRIDIGNNCYIGTHVSLGLDTRLESDVAIDDQSEVPDGIVVPHGSRCQGIPLKAASFDLPAGSGPQQASPFLYGVLHLVLIYAMGYLLIVSALPGLALAAYALTSSSIGVGMALLLLAAPVSLASYAACVIGVKKLFLGRMPEGTFSVYSPQYLRIWFNRYLMANTRQILMPLYATVYLPWFYRALGAKIAKGSEISTLNEAIPDLLEIGEGSFLADECIIGPMRIHAGMAQLRPVRIGARTFVGNSALVKGGTTIGDNSLLALMSTSSDLPSLAAGGGQWLGSPAFPLPRPAQEHEFSENELFAPDAGMMRKRYYADAVRIVLPSLIWTASMLMVGCAAIASFEYLPVWAWLIALPAASLAAGALEILAVAAVKQFVAGRFAVSVHPLWSDTVILDEIVNGAYESLSATTMVPLQGTPFLAPALRLLGCRIGKWCFLDTTYFSEFDLVEIGDHAAINQGATIQTHLFEDRVMKSGEVKIGRGCSVGNMGIVLYDTVIGDGASTSAMSVVMKGERLGEDTNWMGIPCQPKPRRVVPLQAMESRAAAALVGQSRDSWQDAAQ